MNNSTKSIKILSLLIFLSISVFAQNALKYAVTRTTNINYQSIAISGDVPLFGSNSTDDNTSNVINLTSLGFNGFVYAGSYSVTGVRMCSNGYLILDPSITSTEYSNSGKWGTSTEKVLTLAPFFDDLLSSIDNGTLESIQKSFRYQITGTPGSQVFVAEWINMQHIDYIGSRLNFQVRLYEADDRIEFAYGNMIGFNGSVNDGATYTVGISGTLPGIVLNQDKPNQLSFSTVPATNLSNVPACNSMITFTPSANANIYTVTVSSPFNDNCSGAPSIQVTNGFVPNSCDVYSTRYSTTSTGIVVNTATGLAADVWFKFTVNSLAEYNIAVIPSGDYDANMELFSGGCATTLTSIHFSPYNNAGFTNKYTTTLSGGTYYFRVFDDRGPNAGFTDGAFNVSVYQTALPPSNDNCSGAKVLALGTPLNSGNTSSATPSLNMPAVCNSAIPDDDVWYSFTATSLVTNFTVTGSINYAPAVQVFSEGCPTSVTSAFNCKVVPAGDNLTYNFTNLSVGGIYILRVFHSPQSGTPIEGFTITAETPTPSCPLLNPTVGTITTAGTNILSWNTVSNPAADAYQIEVSSNNFASNVLTATTSGSNYTISGGTLTAGLTYKWKVTSININGKSKGGCGFLQFDTYSTKPSCPTLTSPLNTATGVGIFQNLMWTSGLNNDHFTISINGSAFNNITTSSLPITLTSGLTYTWTVTPFNSIGEVPLQTCQTLSFQTVAVNDEYTSATSLFYNSNGIYSGVNATNSNISGCTGIADDDLWFVFTAQPSNFIKATGGTQYNAVIEVFTRNGSTMTGIGCYNNFGKGEAEKAIITGLTTGTVYYARIFHSGTGSSTTPEFSVHYYNGVSVDALSANNYCAGSNISLGYSYDNTVTGSIRAELSDGAGSFATPILLASTTVSGGLLSLNVPAAIASGSSYRLRIISGTNSDATLPFSIKGNVAEAQSITTSSILSINRKDAVFNVGNINNADYYTWTLPTGLTTTGVVTTLGNSLTIDLPGNTFTGIIKVKGGNICFTGLESSYDLTVSITGISETLSKSISVYPNPALGFVIIKSSVGLGKTSISISDLVGKTIKILDVDLISSYELSLSDLSSGVYLLSLSSDKGKYVTTLIKE